MMTRNGVLAVTRRVLTRWAAGGAIGGASVKDRARRTGARI